MNKPIKLGFVPSLIDNGQYVFGGSFLPKDVLQADGNWSAYLPTYEPQFNDSFDSFGCTTWGTQNALETLYKKIYGGEHNFSERYTYITSDTRPPGNDPHTIAETIRKFGLVDNDVLPMTEDFDEFLRPTPMSKSLVSKGKKWLREIDYRHEWVFHNSPDKHKRVALLKEALQYSPVALSVTAWIKEGDVYVDNDQPNCHWTMCFGLKEENGETYPLIFDSYDQTLKVLHPDHHIECAKRFYIKKKEVEKSWWRELLEDLFVNLRT